MADSLDEEFERPSKSQRKRDMDALKELGTKLLDVPDEQLEKMPDPALVEAVRTGRGLARGSARKRQIQYIGKLLRDESLAAAARHVIDRLDASSRVHVQAFHRLEQWRDRLVQQDPDVMTEILGKYPETDRQQLRQLVRKAIDEVARDVKPPIAYRKLFQFLKQTSGEH